MLCSLFPVMYEVITEQGARNSCQAAGLPPPGEAAAGGEWGGAAKRGSSSPLDFPWHKGELKSRLPLLPLPPLPAVTPLP